jgi:hypothetical protein
MPAIHELADGHRRVEAIKDLGIYHTHVYQPILCALNIGRRELRKAA